MPSNRTDIDGRIAESFSLVAVSLVGASIEGALFPIRVGFGAASVLVGIVGVLTVTRERRVLGLAPYGVALGLASIALALFGASWFVGSLVPYVPASVPSSLVALACLAGAFEPATPETRIGSGAALAFTLVVGAIAERPTCIFATPTSRRWPTMRSRSRRAPDSWRAPCDRESSTKRARVGSHVG